MRQQEGQVSRPRADVQHAASFRRGAPHHGASLPHPVQAAGSRGARSHGARRGEAWRRAPPCEPHPSESKSLRASYCGAMLLNSFLLASPRELSSKAPSGPGTRAPPPAARAGGARTRRPRRRATRSHRHAVWTTDRGQEKWLLETVIGIAAAGRRCAGAPSATPLATPAFVEGQPCYRRDCFWGEATTIHARRPLSARKAPASASFWHPRARAGVRGHSSLPPAASTAVWVATSSCCLVRSWQPLRGAH